MIKKFENFFYVILENIPTILTIVIGAFVVLKNQQEAYEISKLLGWIITILALMATSMLIERFGRLQKIEKNVTETNNFLKNQEGKASLDTILVNRKQVHSLELRLKYAKDIRISGASLFRLTTEYLGFLQEKAKEGCKFKFLLLDPNCEAAKLVATHIVYEVNDNQTYINNINTTISNLTLLKKKYPDNIEIKIADFIPSFSIFITDPEKEDGTIRVEIYTQAVPTRERPQLALSNNREPHWFKFFLNQFDEMWRSPYSKDVG